MSHPRFRMKPGLGRLTYLATASLALALALAGCGGGDSTPAATTTTTPPTAASAQTVQTTTANTTTVPESATSANDTIVSASQAVVAAGQAGATITCAGGGTAVYQVTAPTLALATNGQFDTGENYSLTFTNCTAATGLDSVNGSLTLNVVAASATELSLATATNDIVVTEPRGTVTLNGSSTFDRTITTSGATTTTASEWKTPSYTIVTAFNARTSTYTFTDIDLTRTVVTTSGTVTSIACSGTGTFSAVLPDGTFTVTETTQGNVLFDAQGTPTQGSWTLVLPHNTIMISISGGVATVSVDYGSLGIVDKVYTFQVTDLETEAG
jgi:hypothetical protein